MKGQSFAYRDDEIEAVAGWLKEGLSAGQISGLLSRLRGAAVSRNAIIGLVHRNAALAAIGFERRGPRRTPNSVAPRPAAARSKPTARTDPRPAMAGPSAVERLFGAPAAPGAPGASVAPVAPPGPVAPAAARAERQAVAPPPIGFLEAVDRGRCLFFAGDPLGESGPDMPVCGAERAHDLANTRYCRRHAVRSVGQGTPAERAAPRILRRALA